MFIREVKSVITSYSIHYTKLYETTQGEIKTLIQAMSRYDVIDIQSVTQSLEDFFMHFYGEMERGNNNVK